LNFTLKSVDRTLSALEGNEAFDTSQFSAALRELHTYIIDEIDSVNFWRVERPGFLAKDSLELGDRFKIAHKDAEEAGKCLAFDRNTAAVFHLMRVMEVGLRELAKSLNDSSLDPRANPSWEKILERCDRELGIPSSERSHNGLRT
jgi:hypothetical protein